MAFIIIIVLECYEPEHVTIKHWKDAKNDVVGHLSKQRWQ